MSKSGEVRTRCDAAGNWAWLERQMWVREGQGMSLGRTLDDLLKVSIPEGFLSWSDIV